MALVAGACCASAGQTFPSKPVRLVASTPPGGTIDLVARLSRSITSALGQAAIVENKAGAGEHCRGVRLQGSGGRSTCS